MSFDIFLRCLRNGEEAPIPRKMFDAIFGPHDTYPQSRENDPGYMVVDYPDGSGGAIYSDYEDGKDATGMMFNHCGGPSFWADLYELADRSRSIIFWPSKDSFYLYTNETVPKEIPKSTFEGGGRLIKNGFDIVAEIEKS